MHQDIEFIVVYYHYKHIIIENE
uniref:Uncharacterized protein n=1 Tax=Anguilla anguilla TaxID=7936 RepID=A0A0E9RPM9_ANGAN